MARFSYHNKWSGDKRRGNDLALLTLNQPSNELPIMLPEANQIFRKNDKLEGLGWGRTSANSQFSTLLQEGKLDYVPNEECKELGILRGNIKKGMMCLGRSGVGICTGKVQPTHTYSRLYRQGMQQHNALALAQ